MSFRKLYYSIFFLISGCFLETNIARASDIFGTKKDTIKASARQHAMAFVQKIDTLAKSSFWPNIKPKTFLENIKLNINKPLSIYEGVSTNFCGYAALSYILLHDEPLLYAKFMIELYEHGEAIMGKTSFRPSSEIKQAVGTMKFKGKLDIRPADQMWFLSLADHFKGYLNLFDKHYDAGDEDKLWASVNYAKFNRMLRELLDEKVDAIGSDLIHPAISDLYEYINSMMKTGTMVLYINNTFLYKKTHSALKLAVPTHYIILQEISKVDDTITIVYWDYGGRSLRQLTTKFLQRITYGITHCTKKMNDVE